MSESSNNRIQDGFSLIETAIAIALLALILGGMFAVLERGFFAARKTRQQTVAYSLIREKLEEKFTSSVWPPTPETPAAPVAGFGDFTREVLVTQPFLGFNELAQITVTVWWDGGNKSQTIATIKANY